MPAAATDVCAIDFGTSHSAIALPQGDGVRLVVLEGTQRTMPTAVFYAVEGLAPHEEPHRHYGRAAVAAYVEGTEGRLMRSMKSILGSSLATQATERLPKLVLSGPPAAVSTPLIHMIDSGARHPS